MILFSSISRWPIVNGSKVPGKIALWLEDESKGENFGTQEGDTIGLKISSKKDNKFFFYIPACAKMTDELSERIKGCEMILFDGTLWKNDEMASKNVGEKTGQRMGHMNNSGPNGSMEALKDLKINKKIYIHINTTNPIEAMKKFVVTMFNLLVSLLATFAIA